ncbi:hypothetical protein JNN96_33625 [Mycobacterium sp. DSM 3803]|nr:hypothetical protein [Mycobacterium sp. DSM 3803]
MPPYQPLFTGRRTGFSHPGCYAQVSEDCDEKQSNEHTLGRAILTAFSDGKLVSIGQRPFQEPGRIDRFTPKSLGANILCKRHNNGLSELDNAALRLILTLDRFYEDQAGVSGDYDNEFDLFSGEVVERWMLKMVWGESESYPTNPKILGEIRRRQLADYLFRDGHLPHGWGLYVTGHRAGRRVDPERALDIRLEERDGELRSGSLDVGGVRLTFAIGVRVPSAVTAAIYRPSVILLTRAGTDRHKVAALSWDNTMGVQGEAAIVHYSV